MTEGESFNKNAVELDGIWLETIVSHPVLNLPIIKTNSGDNKISSVEIQ